MMPSSSSSSATVRVEKATSDLLIGPDWTMNMDICDSINSNRWDAKDVVKAVKKRLQHKNPRIQLLALTRSGVVFPQRSLDAAPIFTPPVAQSTLRHAQAGYGMPINSSTRLDEAMAAEMENLSLSSINSMRTVLDLLADMLQAVNPSDRASVKDEVIVDLVNRVSFQPEEADADVDYNWVCPLTVGSVLQPFHKSLTMLVCSVLGISCWDEDLLAQGLELNDNLQSVLAKHDAHIPPAQNLHMFKQSSQTPTANNSALVAASVKGQVEKEEDEEEDDFAQLARRHSKTRSATSIDSSTGTSESVTSVPATNNAMSSIPATAALVPSNALALPDPPAPVRTTKEQDMIDLLSLALTTTTASPHAPVTPLSYGYPPPPWAPTPGYLSNQNHLSTTPYTSSTPRANTLASYTSMQPARSLQHVNLFPARSSNGLPMNGEASASSAIRTSAPAAGQKTFVPSYRLFEDLNVLGNGDGRFHMTSSTSSSLSGSQSMVGWRK
ncbi:ENTH/VHS/GAT family protein [Actinidia rufa]|uniref:ENTH/VHS/GAT family protein n=1 Tax=Actinidia rufa TaxID=165716 RepID=A0A7J0EBG3_9ERIC|nr:ENTH/VHS/GAT family protein [Actinidia rufa]